MYSADRRRKAPWGPKVRLFFCTVYRIVYCTPYCTIHCTTYTIVYYTILYVTTDAITVAFAVSPPDAANVATIAAAIHVAYVAVIFVVARNSGSRLGVVVVVVVVVEAEVRIEVEEHMLVFLVLLFLVAVAAAVVVVAVSGLLRDVSHFLSAFLIVSFGLLNNNIFIQTVRAFRRAGFRNRRLRVKTFTT